MTEIYLIRHTQAEGNRYRIMQGHWDGGVTATGLKQIELLAERFRDLPVDAVYSSDLYRARLTATAITRWGGQALQIDTRLREINVGPWETRFFGNVFHDEPEQARRFIRDPETFSLEGAETYAQVRTRACEALGAIARANPGRRVAVVSHGVTIRCALSGITGIDLRDVERLPICKNTAVTHLLWDGERFSLDYYNDASHLAPLGEAPWSRNGDVRHERFDPASDPDFYKDCYTDAWLAAHGDLEGFSAPGYYHAAREHYRRDPDSVLRMLVEDRCIGLLDMDTARGAHAGYGWISLVYLRPEYRRQGYGIQLLGRAYLHYQGLGRKSVRLNVAEENRAARAFYEKEGFSLLGSDGGAKGLLLMEKKLEEVRHGG